jgi:hypothetical protein
VYEEFETKTSYKYLEEVISSLAEPVCILGGWAIFFQVNEKFQEAQGRPYLGSRDIDVGFHLGKNISKEELQKSALVKSIKILEKLKFKSVSFRMYKEVHTETEEEIQEGQKIPSHFVFPMYVDLIVDNIPKNFKEVVGFNPIDEPLLEFAFNGESSLVKEFEKKLLLPSTTLLLAMKINSLPNRQKDHKKTKDLCDIFSLLWYSDININSVREELLKLTTKNKISKCLKSLSKDDFERAAPQLNHSVAEISRVINQLE